MQFLPTWFSDLSVGVQSVIISSITTIALFIIGGVAKLIYDRYSLNYKMKREYNFQQRKKIKENLSQSKTPLIKAAEELNYRLWNLSRFIDKRWHNVEESEWKEDKRYYLKSTVYRFLMFLYWTLKAENSIYCLDLTMADKKDQIYLKYIKTLKHFFCESSLLEALEYSGSHDTNHFYKDNLIKYVSYLEENGKPISYLEFDEKFCLDYKTIKTVIQYIVNIESQSDNLNYNTIKAFHLFLIQFLNRFGLDYHKTSIRKIKKILDKYHDLKIKNEYLDFLKRNKIYGSVPIITCFYCNNFISSLRKIWYFKILVSIPLVNKNI